MKKQLLVAVLLTLVLLLSRWPGLMPYGFSAVYGFCFCAGVYLPLKLCWGIFLPALFCSDIALNLYYGVFNNALNKTHDPKERNRYVSSMQGLTTTLTF